MSLQRRAVAGGSHVSISKSLAPKSVRTAHTRAGVNGAVRRAHAAATARSGAAGARIHAWSSRRGARRALGSDAAARCKPPTPWTRSQRRSARWRRCACRRVVGLCDTEMHADELAPHRTTKPLAARVQAKIASDGRHRFAPSPKTLCAACGVAHSARARRADALAARASDSNVFILRRDGACYGCLTTRDVTEAGAAAAPAAQPPLQRMLTRDGDAATRAGGQMRSVC
jgi:hypothetical protein